MDTILKKLIRTAMLLFVPALIWQGVRADTVYAAAPDAIEADDMREKGGTHREYVVAQDGSGDFRTIQEAVDNAEDGDTIWILPGVYYENVVVWDKGLNLIGTDKDECEIRYDTASYLCVPLEIASGKVSNLTIYGIHGREGGLLPEEAERIVNRFGEELAMEYIERTKEFSGYAVHADQNGSYGKELIFEDCRIISENGACVGMGSRGGEKIIFKGCELLSKGLQGCIFLHDSPLPELGGETYFALVNCRLQIDNTEGMMRFDQWLDCNDFIFNFRNVMTCVPDNMPAEKMLWINNHSENAKAGWQGLNNTMLAPGSSGNTMDIMNWDINELSEYERSQLFLFGGAR